MENKPYKVATSPKFIQNIVFSVILIALLLLVCRLFAPFFTVLLWSTILFVILNPLHRRICRKLDFSTIPGKILQNIIAGAFALGTAVIILIPLLFVASQFLRQIMELSHTLRNTFLERPTMFRDVFESISSLINSISPGQFEISADELMQKVTSLLNNSMNTILSFSKGIALNITSFFVTLVFMVFCLFFFYLDGAFLSNLFLNLIPIKQEYIITLVKKFKDITKNLFLGYIIVALVQAVLAYLVFIFFGVNGALVFACLVFICVFIPMVGGALVWLPLGIARMAGGDFTGGIIFLIVSAVFISLFDNILRPFFLQNRIQLHPLIIFFAILGGITTFGFNGLVLGPMIVILFLTVLDIFLTEHKIEHRKPKIPGET